MKTSIDFIKVILLINIYQKVNYIESALNLCTITGKPSIIHKVMSDLKIIKDIVDEISKELDILTDKRMKESKNE